MQNNANVQTTSVTQTANELLGTGEKTLYFLVLETPAGKMTINVGKKTHDEVKKLTAPREQKTVIQILEPEQITGNPVIDAVNAYKKEHPEVETVEV